MPAQTLHHKDMQPQTHDMHLQQMYHMAVGQHNNVLLQHADPVYHFAPLQHAEAAVQTLMYPTANPGACGQPVAQLCAEVNYGMHQATDMLHAVKLCLEGQAPLKPVRVRNQHHQGHGVLQGC